jgi:hypothetical protein
MFAMRTTMRNPDARIRESCRWRAGDRQQLGDLFARVRLGDQHSRVDWRDAPQQGHTLMMASCR